MRCRRYRRGPPRVVTKPRALRRGSNTVALEWRSVMGPCRKIPSCSWSFCGSHGCLGILMARGCLVMCLFCIRSALSDSLHSWRLHDGNHFLVFLKKHVLGVQFGRFSHHFANRPTNQTRSTTSLGAKNSYHPSTMDRPNQPQRVSGSPSHRV